ncbi:hypothetical protein AAMO2058_000167500 [Amorphochlora amoebiformis]
MVVLRKEVLFFIVCVCAVIVAISQLDVFPSSEDRQQEDIQQELMQQELKQQELKQKVLNQQECKVRSKTVLPFAGGSNRTAHFLRENNWNVSSVPWSPNTIGSFFGTKACPYIEDGNPVELKSLTDLLNSSLRYSCYTAPYVPKHLGERHWGPDILYEKISIKKVVRVGMLGMTKPLLHVDNVQLPTAATPVRQVREQGCLRRGFAVNVPQGFINYNHWFTHHGTVLAQWYRLQNMEPQCPIQIVLSTPFCQPELKSKIFYWFLSDFPSYVYQTLEAIGCEERNIVKLTENTTKIEAFDELYSSSHVSSTLNSQSTIAYEFYSLVRRGLVYRYLVYGHAKVKRPGAIIVRKLMGKDKKKHGAEMCPRRAVGMDNIIDWLATEHKFEALELSGYKTLKDKVDILKNRRMVVIEAGSSCVNMLFMSDNTRVAILAGPYFETDWYSNWLAEPCNIVGTEIRAGSCGNRTTSKEDWYTCAIGCAIEPLTLGRCCPWNVHLDHAKSEILAIMPPP